MMKKQSTDSANGEKAAGTGLRSVSPRDSGATPPLRNGPSGEKAESGNRNKRG